MEHEKSFYKIREDSFIKGSIPYKTSNEKEGASRGREAIRI